MTKPKKSKSKKTGSPIWHLKVVSSNIDKAAYHVTKKLLSIKFKSGKVYRYSGVSIKEFTDFTQAESQGSWFSKNIRDEKDCEEIK